MDAVLLTCVAIGRARGISFETSQVNAQPGKGIMGRVNFHDPVNENRQVVSTSD